MAWRYYILYFEHVWSMLSVWGQLRAHEHGWRSGFSSKNRSPRHCQQGALGLCGCKGIGRQQDDLLEPHLTSQPEQGEQRGIKGEVRRKVTPPSISSFKVTALPIFNLVSWVANTKIIGVCFD